MDEKTIKTQFTSDNQPSPESKSKGMKKSWEYRKARQQMFEELCEIEMPDGSKKDFWKLCVDRLHRAAFEKDSGLSKREKTELIMRLCKEFMPEDSNLNIETDKPIRISFDRVDQDL